MVCVEEKAINMEAGRIAVKVMIVEMVVDEEKEYGFRVSDKRNRVKGDWLLFPKPDSLHVPDNVWV